MEQPVHSKMSRRIEINGKFYRKRRGKLVEIPSEWVERGISKQEIRLRKAAKEQLRLWTGKKLKLQEKTLDEELRELNLDLEQNIKKEEE